MKSYFFFFVRLAIAILFIYAGAVKVVDPGRFIEQILAFHLVSYTTAFLAAHLVPMLEILCGILLLTMKYSCAASVLLIALTSGFICLLSILKASGVDTDCGCFGNWHFLKDFTSHIIFNASLIVLLTLHAIRNAKLQSLMGRD